MVALRLRRWAQGAFETLTVNAAHAVFSQHRWVGLLIIAALATLPRCLVLAACALAAAELTVRGLRLSSPYVPYGYNALLCGIAIGREYVLSPASAAFASVLGAGSVLVTAALTSLAGYAGFLPVLSIPFVLTTWFATGLSPNLPLMAATPAPDVWGELLPRLLALPLQSFGALVLIPDVQAGLCVFVALLLHSRIASVLATLAILFVIGLFQLAHAPLSDSALQPIAASAGLTAIAIGGVWLIPSRGASFLALAGALLSAFFALGLLTPLGRLGLALDFVPFQVAALALLSALRLRAAGAQPRLAAIVAESPEQLLLNDVPAQPEAVSGVRLSLPFVGPWCCTQGVEGAYTHRGALRHAYDFEICGRSDGALCEGSGARAKDYHCFGQPVLAAADGTVVAIETGIPNNAIGEDNARAPWGNYVILHHAPAVYSLVAHLAPQTASLVFPGQFVWRGQVLGYCGSSGRAPRPHLHFQVQSTPALGSPTRPSCFHDVIVRREGPPRFEPAHIPAHGDSLESLRPDVALAARLEFPLGLTLSYDVAGRIERIVSDIDIWGRPVLRSLDRRAELVIERSQSCFSCTELRGTQESVLTLLRLALPRVPFERHPELTFETALPARWFGGWLQRLWWDLEAPFRGPQRIDVRSSVAVESRGIAIVGRSLELDAGGEAVIETRALFGVEPAPTVLEVRAFGRVQRAELVLQPNRRSLPTEASAHAASPLAINARGWS